MSLKPRTILSFAFMFIQLNVFGQLKEVNLYVGAQSLNISPLNEWEVLGPDWDFKTVKAALSSELSVNYYPFKNKRFFVQTGLKYFRLKGQDQTIEFISALEGIDLGGSSDPQYGEFRYGFDFNYWVLFISPAIRFDLAKGLYTTFSAGILVHRASASQEGIQIFVDPDTFAWTTAQYSGRYNANGLDYNLSVSIYKEISKRWSMSLKGEYNFIETTIGEESRSIWYGNSINEENITVPIHKGTLDLSGFNIMLGASYRLGEQ